MEALRDIDRGYQNSLCTSTSEKVSQECCAPAPRAWLARKLWEFNRVIDALASSEKDDGIVFDVVVPSLPGYCWSEVEKHPKGWTLQDTARVLNKLMLDLGYKEYVTSGGDWGHWVGHT